MDTSQQARGCPYCGSTEVTVGIRLGKTAETGDIGPKYKSGFLLRGTEPLDADLCRGCGTVVRLYVKETNRQWVTAGASG